MILKLDASKSVGRRLIRFACVFFYCCPCETWFVLCSFSYLASKCVALYVEG